MGIIVCCFFFCVQLRISRGKILYGGVSIPCVFSHSEGDTPGTSKWQTNKGAEGRNFGHSENHFTAIISKQEVVAFRVNEILKWA